MNRETVTGHQKQVYYRLVSLWAVCEAFAGGILHGAQIPMTGMIISGLAVICISLIARESQGRFSILKAALLVSLVKLALSPHSPPTAYIAVLFQGLMGEWLLRNTRHLGIKTMILGFLALVESAVQRILVLLLIFGNGFWQAVNQYIKKLTGAQQVTDYTFRLALAYIVLHAIAGLLIGWYASTLVRRSAVWKIQHPEWILPEAEPDVTEWPHTKKKRVHPLRWLMISIWVFLLVAWLFPSFGLIPGGEAPAILIRSFLIIGCWWIFLSPLFMMFLKKKLQQEKERDPAEWEQIMLMVPVTRALFTRCWQKARKEYPDRSVSIFIKLVMVNILQ